MYWYKPTLCWRQTLDIVYVKFALFYHILRGYNSYYVIIYYITLGISLCFYPLGIYLYNKQLYWESTYAHSMVHIISNLSNLILYSGSIIPLDSYFEYFNDTTNYSNPSNPSNLISVLSNTILPNTIFLPITPITPIESLGSMSTISNTCL